MVWCPKYRRKVLVGEVAEELRSLLYQKEQELEVTIEALEIMPDHVYLFLEYPDVGFTNPARTERSGGNVSRWGERCLRSRRL